jgi:hypothetical protein
LNTKFIQFNNQAKCQTQGRNITKLGETKKTGVQGVEEKTTPTRKLVLTVETHKERNQLIFNKPQK